jgi:hypothetical protein
METEDRYFYVVNTEFHENQSCGIYDNSFKLTQETFFNFLAHLMTGPLRVSLCVIHCEI